MTGRLRPLALLLALALLLTGCAGGGKTGATCEPTVEAATSAAPTGDGGAEAAPAAAGTPDATREPTAEAAEPTAAPDFVGDRALYLYIRDDIVHVGKTTNMEIVVLCGADVTQDICIYDEKGSLRRTIPNRGGGRYEDYVQIYSSEACVGALCARAGEVESAPAAYYVQPQVTQEMVDRLDQAGCGLVDYIRSCGYADPWSDEALDAAAAWLEGNAEIQSVARSEDGLFFFTRDNLAGAFGFDADTAADGAAGFSAADEVFEDWQAGESVADAFLESGLAPTSDHMLVLQPEEADETMRYFADHAQSLLSQFADSNGGTLELKRGRDAMVCIRDGSMNDCGFLMFCAHGRMEKLQNAGSFLTMRLDVNTKENRETMGEEDLDYLWGGSSPEETRIFKKFNADRGDDTVCSFMKDVVGDPVDVNIMITPRYLDSALGDRTFDNTVVFLFVCEALSDPDLQEVFFRRGASSIVGCERTFTVGYALYILHSILQGWLDADAQGRYGSLRGCFEGVQSEIAQAAVHDAIDWAEKKAEWMRIFPGTDAVNGDLTLSERRVRDAKVKEEQKDGLVYSGEPVLYGATAAPTPETEDWDDFSQVYHDLLVEAYQKRPASLLLRDGNSGFGEYAYRGCGRLTGVVTDERGEGLSGVQISLYRWLNHSFAPLTDATGAEVELVTGADGSYCAEEVPCGLYVAQARREEQETRGVVSVAQGEYELNLTLSASRLILTARVEDGADENFTRLCARPSAEASSAPDFAQVFENSVAPCYAAYAEKIPGYKKLAIENARFGPDPTYADIWVGRAYATGSLLSLQINTKDYITGGAHSVYDFQSFTFDLAECRALKLTDLLDPAVPGARDELKALWMQRLNPRANDLWKSVEETVEEGLRETMGGWQLTAEGLTLYFHPYEAASFGAGTLEVTLPYDQLAGILRRQYLPQAANPATAGTCAVVGRDDARCGDSAYALYGEGSGQLLAVDGTVSQLCVTLQQGDEEDSAPGVVFYASDMTNGLIRLSEFPGRACRVSWLSGGERRELRLQG